MERTIREQFSDMAVVLSIKEPGSKAFNELYIEMLQFLNNLDGLYVILSTEYMEKTRGLSVPLALKKEKMPSIYIFTDLELAKNWCKHYRHFYDGDKAPIGYLPKSEFGFLYVFQIAFQLGIYKCMVNEGDRLLCLNIADMIKANNLNQGAMLMNVETIESYLKKNKQPKLMVRFNSVDVIDFHMKEEDIAYLNEIKDNAFTEFSDAIKEMGFTAVNKGKTFPNAGIKLITVFANSDNDLFEAYKEKKLIKIEKLFFEAIEKYDSKKLFDSRYSYLKFESREKYPTDEEYFS